MPTFTRNALYELIWTEPRLTLAKKLGISDVAIAKACARANIPGPPPGYWAQKLAGKSVIRPLLPVRGFGQSDEIEIGENAAHRAHTALIEEIPPDPVFDESVEALRERARKSLGTVKFSRSLDHPHKDIAKLLAEDERRRVEVQKSAYYWNKPRFDAPQAQRRLRILNVLFLALAKLGAKSETRGEATEARFCVGHVPLELALKPVSKNGSRTSQVEPSSPTNPPFVLSASAWNGKETVLHEWRDNDSLKLEQQLTDISVELLVLAEITYRGYTLNHGAWLRERKAEQEEEARKKIEQQRREQRERQLQYERAQREHLLQLATDLRQANEIRSLVRAITERYESDPAPGLGD